MNIFNDFGKALDQITDPRFMQVFFLGIGLTIALLIGFYAATLYLLNWAYDGAALNSDITWFGDLLGFGSLVFMLVLSVFLMVPVASAITSFFLDDVARAVEDMHYPSLPNVPRVSFYDGFRDTVNFLGVLIGANIAALLIYVILPFLAPLIFWALNGFLLGREYIQVVAMRRLGRAGAKEFRKAHQREVWIAGCLMAMPLSIPLINLTIPVLGAATFTHLYHRLQGSTSG